MLRIKTAYQSIIRILTFRARIGDIEDDLVPLLLVGILLTWVVGIGRWWDDPREIPPLARMGLGSVAYVFVLSGLLWLISYPLARERVSYLDFAAFIAATSLPGIVYALPIEAISPNSTASAYNITALIFVSAYRVSLLIWFLSKILKMSVFRAIVTTFFPISLITGVISLADLGDQIINMMGGFRNNVPQSAAREVVLAIGYISFVLAPLLLIIYVAMIIGERDRADHP